MPRVSRHSSKLSQRETGICLRLKQARDIAEVTQEKLAAIVKVPRDRLSSYEKCRTPLRCDLALRICRQLIISEEWLATGQTEIMDSAARDKLVGASSGLAALKPFFRRRCVDLLSDPQSLSVPPGTLFSEAFDKVLAITFRRYAESFFYSPRIVFSDAVPEPELAARMMRVQFAECSLLLDHSAGLQGKDSWLIQRNFLRAMYELSRKACGDFMQLGLDVGSFQLLIRGMLAGKVKTRPAASDATQVVAAP